MSKPTPERFTLTLEAVADPLARDAYQRLRKLLKVAGRQLALRCVRIEPAAPAKPDQPTRGPLEEYPAPAAGSRESKQRGGLDREPS